jgi:predicted transcriptional regulator
MKRGRPNKRSEIQTIVMDVLSSSSNPQTTSSLRKAASLRLGKEISWNTMKKYLRELVQVNRVQPIILPHCKDPTKEGLTLYTLKK